jgi:hypothetical protein
MDQTNNIRVELVAPVHKTWIWDPKWTWSTINLVGRQPKELVNPLNQQGEVYDGTSCSNK